MAQPRLKFWGWGYEGEVLAPDEVRWLEGMWAQQFHIHQFDPTPPPTADEIHLRPSRLSIPAPLLPICTAEHYERLLHSHGASFPDSVRIFARDFSNPPDVIAYPRHVQDVLALLDWCGDVGAAIIPFGGGTSVVGGVEPPRDYPAVVTVDMARMNRVLEIDPVSQTALIQAGTRGPELERQLKSSELTLRFFPQSFACSTLGGWIATRAGGHFATLYTHIDDLVESLQAVTPRGIVESHRFPASGAGPAPERLWLGSEGILGIVTQAWVRLHPRPTYRAATTVRFQSFFKAVEAVRAISQARLYPANCRLLDPLEALTNMVGDGRHAVLLLAFESADHSVDAWLQRALELCADYGGEHGTGPETIVFAHGLLWSCRMFDAQVALLKERYRCVTFDFRGQGHSEVTRSGYDMETLYEDAAALIEQLGCAPCHFLGLSMGGFIGLRLAARHPELVRSLILLETSADPEPSENVAKYRQLTFVARWFGLGLVVDRVMPVMFGRTFLTDPVRAQERREWRGHMSGNHRIGVTRATTGVITREGVYDEIDRIRLPTLILVGDEDVAVPPVHSQRLHERIAGSRLEIIPHAGHTSTVEEPTAVNVAITNFLGSLS
jgi:pimeloyl-ACP methyl ester carboxylesterase